MYGFQQCKEEQSARCHTLLLCLAHRVARCGVELVWPFQRRRHNCQCLCHGVTLTSWTLKAHEPTASNVRYLWSVCQQCHFSYLTHLASIHVPAVSVLLSGPPCCSLCASSVSCLAWPTLLQSMCQQCQLSCLAHLAAVYVPAVSLLLSDPPCCSPCASSVTSLI